MFARSSAGPPARNVRICGGRFADSIGPDPGASVARLPRVPHRVHDMARSAPTRPTRKRTPSRRPAARAARAPRPASRSPLLHRDLRRELTGIGAIGAGVILAAVLILPGGGAVAGPVHDGLFGAFGIGAWIGVAGLVLTGARLCMTPEWRAGTLAALGSAVAMVALLGLIGMVRPPTRVPWDAGSARASSACSVGQGRARRSWSSLSWASSWPPTSAPAR